MKIEYKKTPLWIVTDIDGTLMDHQYDFSPALSTIKWLQELGIPIIPCTSKTAAEVRALRLELGITDPFIVENGGAIYGDELSSNEEWELVLGKSYKYLRSKLELISLELGYKLIPLNDLSYQEINELTGLEGRGIELALDRKWSVPFLNPKDSDRERITEIASSLCTSIYKGNRMSHLLGEGSHKGKAVIELKKFLNQPNIKVVALGDSQNDLPLLEVADIAIVIPSRNGPNKFLKKGIDKGEFLLAPAPHSEGWALAIRDLLIKSI
ncbi:MULTISPECIES: mannosyl-3-phosphoglycerate phosphatase-related protein YedP [Prochlorococcus]|uniref:Predicted hydrolase, HAD superfamily n=1 Tax=Prochlorococcus marinus (strain SARG / CCMP1375 / SS120) TaxID=167539 RepID=Q7VCL1_PROMA|nr:MULTISPECIES: mannosyl-3-phosphoglycerate phosphatase-related protein YedP [Prochlorococcus]AAP99773.1 Predicted hydrolase, HAD superfamily [Prochlorococcus marinus subsp. marinus str. CCMP1375]KGG12750.1 putative mannosyl-3-phosphoglycerate phosphatasee [Prochlorococcus marinus str. LG]KGG22475.1 putative mannosyl-3-phosphoglycerate phosphatasee [Prochlorococcus marinus str. SS2]KGG23782.1 putative mannosyl-3-phosphoglycerate phosphatasee [Prochlorococcus marinus str. SS35]KGG32005.1 putat